MYHVEIDGPKWCRFGSPFNTLASAYCMAKNCADKPDTYGKTRVIDDDGKVHRSFPIDTLENNSAEVINDYFSRSRSAIERLEKANDASIDNRS